MEKLTSVIKFNAYIIKIMSVIPPYMCFKPNFKFVLTKFSEKYPIARE